MVEIPFDLPACRKIRGYQYHRCVDVRFDSHQAVSLKLFLQMGGSPWNRIKVIIKKKTYRLQHIPDIYPFQHGLTFINERLCYVNSLDFMALLVKSE